MSYSHISSHHSMVFDEVRNELYAQAIRKIVTPESVVLDLGAGMGIHGLIAATAGAKRVYLVEPQPVVQIAREVAEANSLAERIIILQGRIEDVHLPEKVDLIISVFTGNLLFSEDLLPSLFYARDHYLKIGGHMMPDMAELMVAPVSAPDIHAARISRWDKPSLGLDFSAGHRFAANEMFQLNKDKHEVERLAPGDTLTTVNLASTTDADCQDDAWCEIQTTGTCHGLLCWIRIRLGAKWLSTDPASPEVHWSPVLLPLDPPLHLVEGEQVSIELQRPARGDWTWTVTARSGTRRHSSFLARAEGLHRLGRLAPSHFPDLNLSGQHALLALTLIKEGKNIAEIAQSLTDADKKSFPTPEAALQLVQRLVSRYAEMTGPPK